MTLVAIVVGLWACVLVVDLYRIQSELRAGRSELQGLTIDRVDAAGGIGPLADRADRHLRRADHLAHASFGLAPLTLVPGLVGQVRGIQNLTAVTASLGHTARHEADGLQHEIDRGTSSDRRLALLDDLAGAAQRIQTKVAAVHLDTHRVLLPPLSDARHQLDHELTKVHRKLGDSRKTLASMRTFLARDHLVLILGSNNAEMRGGNGMPLSAGVAHIHDGQIEMGGFVQTSDLWNPNGPVCCLPTDLLATYGPRTGGFAIGQEWRETDVSPNFVESAPIYARMAQRQGLGTVDSVMLVDALSLRALVQATGPITLNGIQYDANNIVQQVLNENYKRFGVINGEVRDQRVDLQSELAKRAFDAFNTRSISPTKLASALLAVTPGRHLLAWSADPSIQATWKRLGIDGGTRADGMLVSTENTSANKLDYYLRPGIALDVERDPTGNWLVTAAVAISDPVRTDTSPYIEGGTVGIPPGAYRTYLDLHLPGDAYNASNLSPNDAAAVWKMKFLKGARDPYPNNGFLQPGFATHGLDPPNKVVGSRYIVPLGTTRTVIVQFHLPAASNHIVVLPSGRLNPQIWAFRGQIYSDAAQFTIHW